MDKQTNKQMNEVYFIEPSVCGSKNKLAEVVKEDLRKREKLESTVSDLQQHVQNHQKCITQLNYENKELEQYGRKTCVTV